ncbi:unnamed protein product, partial [Prorocentrum cordatum]
MLLPGEALDATDAACVLRARVPTLQRALAFVRGPFRNALRKALELIREDKADETGAARGWKLFLLLPRLLLRREAGQQRTPKEQLLERFTRLEAGDWAQRLTEAQPGLPRRPPERDANGQNRAPEARRGRAPDENDELRSRCERVSAARQALTASAVAPGLASLEPDRPLTNVRRSRRGATPCPSGMTTGAHLQTLLDDWHCCDLLHRAATRLAGAETPRPVAEALRLGRLTALRKSNRRARGIVTGDVFRRLVALTLAQQVDEEVEQATAPIQFDFSTGAGTECVAHLAQTLTRGDSAATVVSADEIGAPDLVSKNSMLEGFANLGRGSALLPFCRFFHGEKSKAYPGSGLSTHGFAAPNWHDFAQGAQPPPTHERAHGRQFWAADEDGVQLAVARGRKEATYPELIGSRAFAATLLELPPHTLAVDGDEPHLADLLADARY